ncbi:probable histone chaperone ASF1A [Oryza sativa Japonica Group]|jgi:histone chaperone ASF1|uniref:Os01g0685200 protein n=3 Tax=Oryza TaxID=4527 RepID=A2ZWM2_ORYSJ|nr:probable histone chaperone ASF1A [Oryza sativa Japonica Group]EAZ13119.1 hypothetical protein OsJ_03039 [Oryza sativa Japonica Group]KAF2951704.1 hypothetical protein DAI22_01g282000 [Oryza sativa Japonica Group]BAH00859.1 unnamed protein product [Oryza sativa Japonica Group]BAS73739.1 Os01g0685200 [Oryza sativa Japonica Group]
MSVIDILTRVDAICQKYGRYDAEKLHGSGVAGEDPFARLYASVDADLNECLEKAEAAKQEKNRATVVALNAEIRGTKAKLLEEDLPKLQRLALKKVKGLSKEELAIRGDLVTALPDRIQSIPDGSATSSKKTGLWGSSGSRAGTGIKFDSTYDLEWKLIYVGSAEDENYDQLLESVLVGPVNVGTYRFVLQADPPDPSKIRKEDIIGVIVLLLTCSYMGQEFIRVGYYVNNDNDDEQLREEPPAKLLIDRVQRNILADKPSVTKFPINFHPETSAGAGQEQQQQQQSGSPENHPNQGSKPNPDQ